MIHHQHELIEFYRFSQAGTIIQAAYLEGPQIGSDLLLCLCKQDRERAKAAAANAKASLSPWCSPESWPRPAAGPAPLTPPRPRPFGDVHLVLSVFNAELLVSGFAAELSLV